MDRKGLTVNAVARAIRIVHHLGSLEDSIGAVALARALKLNRSTCFNILKTLADEGWVSFDASTKGYSLGLGLVSLSRQALEKERAIAKFEPALSRIARTHGVTTLLVHRVTPTRLVVLLVCMNDGPLRIQMNVGQRLPLLTGATGRLISAFCDPEPAFLRRQFQQVRWGKAITFDTYLNQVAETRKKGWSVDDGFFAPGAVSVAVPIFEHRKQMRFAFTAVMFHDPKGNGGRRDKLVRDMLDVSRASMPNIRKSSVS
jgi:DNA-binding IclR family transcriptional regulator